MRGLAVAGGGHGGRMAAITRTAEDDLGIPSPAAAAAKLAAFVVALPILLIAMPALAAGSIFLLLSLVS